MGHGEVIHFTGEPARKREASIRRTNVNGFLDGSQLMVREYYVDILPASETCRLARELLDGRQSRYHLVASNCEHLATFCKVGIWDSDQVRFHGGTLAAGLLSAIRMDPAILLGTLLAYRRDFVDVVVGSYTLG